MSEMVIDRAEVFVVAPEVERYTWAEGMTAQYIANIIVKLTSRDGLEGVAGAAMITSHGFDRAVVISRRADTVRPESTTASTCSAVHRS